MAEEGPVSDTGSDSDVEEFSGMEQPPLIKQLKTILAEYPDDGQIIKELVQNAEDAGASDMKILFDGRSLNKDEATAIDGDMKNGTEKSKRKKFPYRKFFKAPALCFYNNEVFSENDWRGIRMIYSSVKEEDPLKVGRFGLGFKSVFHITDYPCIISGNRILLMNPHEKVPGQVCITIKLKDLKKCKRLKTDDFLAAFSGTFGFSGDSLETGQYSGTIFWFPLRETPSDLSDTCYDRSKVLDLFRSFQSEAVHSLLFLKSLCKVEMYCRGADSEYDLPNQEAFFSVELDDADSSIQQERSQFLEDVKSVCGSIPKEDIVCVAHPTFRTRYKTTNSQVYDADVRSWVVINVYKGGHMSDRLKQLINDKDLSYMPYVGAAVPLDNSNKPVKGHIFCFLPLPQEKKSLTGLPVHFNGFFALSQNRRHLKWPSEDQETLHMHRDKSIEWNECLVNEVLPGVYMRLIREMIHMSTNNSNSQSAVEAVYKCIPDDTAVDSKWEGCTKELYKQLMTADFVFLQKGNKWVQPNQPLYTMFDNQNTSCDQRTAVIKLLKSHKHVEATEVPKHIWELLKRKASPKDITPEDLCKLIQSEDVYRVALSSAEKLSLLEYITKEMKNDGNFVLLKGLELLPLHNGDFAVFKEPGVNTRPVYYCTAEQLELFPGQESRIISRNVSKQLEDVLQQLAYLGRFQLRSVAITGMVNLLDETIRHRFGTDEPVRLNLSVHRSLGDWIEKLWKCLFENFSEFLSKFSNLPLIPCLITGSWVDDTWRNGEIHLYRMNRAFLLKSGMDTEELPNDVCDAFQHLSVVVLSSLPDWMDLRKLPCIFSSTGPSLARLFEKIYSETPQVIQDFNSKCKPSEVEPFVMFIDKINSSLKGNALKFLKQLKLFSLKTSPSDMNPVLAAVSVHCQMVNPKVRLPVRFPRPLLIPHNCLSLARKLGAVEVNEEQLVIDALSVMNSAFYGVHEIDEFMHWFLTQIHKFKGNKSIITQARNIAFVPASGGGKFKPSDLYDPRDALLRSLFSGENKFPSKEIASDQHLQALKLLGLRTVENVTPNCLYLVAKHLDQMCKSGSERAKVEEKAKSFLKILEKNPSVLSSIVDLTAQEFHVSVWNLKCLPHQRERPTDYPEGLKWKGSDLVLCSASELRCTQFSKIAGSVIPVVESNSNVTQLFNWNLYPEPKVITKQLENLVEAYTSNNKPCLLSLVCNVYKSMKDRTSEVFRCPEFQTLVQGKCIWWGDGFCLPGQLILERKREDLDLRPYMYTLPDEVNSLKSFFEKLKCHKRQDTNVLLEVLEHVAKKYNLQKTTDHSEVQKDLQLVVQILNKLHHDRVTPERLGDRLLIPVHTGNNERLLMKPFSQCTFCDAQWLKELTEEDDENEEILYVHANVPSHIAEGLGVKSLKMQLMSDAEGLEEWGQEEPLTRRIHNILKDGYVDGLAVPKEIIQNADDAGAKTVQFMYDERENLDARTQLLDEEMAGCQGPALWAYNDAQFSDKDFRNITKLSGASKEKDTTKIGKFGLGFCAVYNLTDVPSFVSGHNMVVFDPHTKYLNKALPGNSPGLKINLKTLKNRRLMRKMNNQFKPFKDVFNCDLSKADPSFSGTLFRLPLRTPTQAASSEIKNVSYSKAEMIILLNRLVESAGNLLLFTQNLQEIEVFHIPPTGVNPSHAVLLCKVTRNIKGQSLDSTVLAACSKLKDSKSLNAKPFSTFMMTEITVECKEHRGVLGNVQAGTTKSQWLVSWATGTSRSLELSYSTNIKGALPLGSVAIHIESEGEVLVLKSLSECPFGFYTSGHVFCYLPLPVKSELDFHVNGSFAVTSDRRGLQSSTEDDKYFSYDSKWNEALLSDAVTQALINVLIGIQDPILSYSSLSSKYTFWRFWPTKKVVLKSFLTGFYQTVMEKNSKVFQAYDTGSWLGLKECLFADEELVGNDNIKEIVLMTLRRFGFDSFPQKNVVDIPAVYLQHLQNVKGSENHLFVVAKEGFFLKVFLPNIKNSFWDKTEESARARIRLMLYCLSHSTRRIDEKIRATDCIPTFACHSLRKPEDLVHPEGFVSRLFSDSDGRFPDKEFGSPNIIQKLVDLGMMKDKLQPDLVKERARSVALLASEGNNKGARERCKYFIEYLSSAVYSQEDIIRDLKDIPFLPVMEKPEHWPFRWRAEIAAENSLVDEKAKNFRTPFQMFLSKCRKLIGCAEYILDSDSVDANDSRTHIFEIMGVKTMSDVRIDTVISQLLEICNTNFTLSDNQSKQNADVVLDEIYQFLNKSAAENPDEIKDKLKSVIDQPIIRVGSEFHPPTKVAFSLKFNCSPELYGIGNDRIKRYRRFLEALDVKERFDVKQLVDSLQKKKLSFEGTALPQSDFQLVYHLLLCLTDLMAEDGLTYETISENHGKDNIFAPDRDKILRPTHTLCFDDCDDIEATSSMNFVHPEISIAAAERLGVLTKRTKHMEDCSMEIPFEQKEELVTRLRRLLDGYPCDTAILKELIQNADDAGATEIHFVTDLRTHACDRIFDRSFSEFQGPALIVYNNSSFTQSDLKGIQQLGIGSKADDPAKTGQYGVGFNAVYNLTDLPSFLTKGPEIEGEETLCVFDPLHKHTKKRVGTRYVDIKTVRKSYPDVFLGYNENVFFSDKQQTGTVFRFPLRISPSEISRTVVTLEKLENIMLSFKQELSEMMLFLKNVTKVTVSKSSSDTFKTERCVSVSLSDEDRRQRDIFCGRLKTFADEYKKDTSKIASLEPLQVGYTLTTKETIEGEKIWYIVQRIGFEGVYEIPETIVTAAKNGRLGMLPIGGIALLLPKINISRSWEMTALRSRLRLKGIGRPYCFLPLPGITGLPVHVNGYFILDHEARRGLWKKEHEHDFKSDWNDMLMTKVIATTYVQALTFAKCQILFPDGEASYTEIDLIDRVMEFDRLFPVAKEATDSSWKYLVKCVFQKMVDNEERLFPVALINKENQGNDCILTWHSVKQSGHRFPLYAVQHHGVYMSIEASFQNSLRLLGMKIANMSEEVQLSFADSGLSLPSPDASAVMNFLKSYSGSEPDKANIGEIPCGLHDTLFKNLDCVNKILDFCSLSDTFTQNLNGLPLLVTNDEILRCFSTAAPVFCSKYATVFPSSAHQFVHEHQIPVICKIKTDKFKPAISEFHIKEVANLLQYELEGSHYTQLIHVDWDPKGSKFPNKFWITRIWEFLEEDFEVARKSIDGLTFMDFLKLVGNWALIPALKGENDHALVQIRGSYSVLAIETFGSIPILLNALKKLQCPFLDTGCLSEHLVNLIVSYLGRADDPVSVLEYLKYYKDCIKNRTLNSFECCAILEFFSSRLETIRKKTNVEDSWITESLKCLPFYIQKDGRARSFEEQNCKVLVIQRGIPENGLEQWAVSTGTVLLQNNIMLRELHKYLGFTYTDMIDVYLRHVLANWDKLPDDAIIPHLQFIRNELLQCPLDGVYKDKQKTLIELLRVTPLIFDNGVRKKASEYFSPHHPVFKAMCKDCEFPPEILRAVEWRKFLELIGMIDDVSASQFIKYAEEIAAEGLREMVNLETARNKSNVLVDYLFKRKEEWKSYIYQQISQIRFVVPFTVDSQYSNIHKQNSDSERLICFRNSISCRFLPLVWTSIPLLPKIENTWGYCNEGKKRQLLGIHKEPPVTSVILHTQNVCDSLKRIFETNRNTGLEMFAWIEPFMDDLYEFLKVKGMTLDETKRRLFHTPVVFIPEEFLLVPAHRVIQDISSEQQISPYLLKAPVRYGKFFDLFTFLGADKYPSFMHYVKVLAMVKEEVKDNKLTGAYLSEWGVIRLALENLFNVLPDTHQRVERETPEGTVLYLPTRDRYMKDSSTLIVADNQYFEQRIGTAGSLQFLIDLKALKLSYELKCIRWLARSVRPKFLSDIVKEIVDTSEMVECQSSLSAIKLERFIHSEHFIGAMLRLLKHYKNASQLEFLKKDEETVALRIQNTRVCQVTGLKTYLSLNGGKIENSVESKDCFVPVPGRSDEDNNMRIYLQITADSEIDLVYTIDDFLITYVHFALSFNIPENVIIKVFRKINEPDSISIMLDRIPIDSYQMSGSVLASVFPEPGTYVPEWLHYLLNCDFSEFKVHEYYSVALELEDEDILDDFHLDSYTPVYIYVRIERMLPNENDAVATREYEVNTGSEIVIVPAFKLYKFIRPTEESSTDVVDAGDLAQPTSNLDRTKIFYSIRRRLQEAWTLSEEDRRHVIKRLYLRWHPDKNIGNEEFCTEVFRYIKEVIYKLQHGIPLDDDDTDGAGQRRMYDDFTSPEYFSFFERMNRRGRRHKDQRRAFYSPGPSGQRSTGYGSCFRDSAKQPFKDHAEARRWQRQAEIDLRRARETLDIGNTDSPAYNWICYMCHQASEKSLKAAGYARDANSVEKNSHDIVSLASGFPAAQGSAALLANLVGIHTRMRYPDVLSRPHIPSTVYTREQAVTACDLAKEILERVAENYLN